MTYPPPTCAKPTEMPVAVAEMQSRLESLYAANLALEREVQFLRSTPPVVIPGSTRPGMPKRLLMRLLPPLRSRFHLRIIRECSLFDAIWYRRTYPDVAGSGIDPVRHFLILGGPERRNPGPQFDTGDYLRRYPDIAQGGINPLVHYILSGRREHRSIRPEMTHGR